MTITIKIKTDNDAFQDGNKDAEIGRMLSRWLAGAAFDPPNGTEPLRDSNGNTVGSIKVTGR